MSARDQELHVHSFSPVADSSSRTLVLGSMPGKASLRAGEYYAHPRNLFWRLMAAHLGIGLHASYADRIAQLQASGVALWDVLESCTRESSLDSDIVTASAVPNDFGEFLEQFPGIETICFNGKKAESSFRKWVAPGLEPRTELTFHALPSTSPANAAVPFAQKLAAWEVIRPGA